MQTRCGRERRDRRQEKQGASTHLVHFVPFQSDHVTHESQNFGAFVSRRVEISEEQIPHEHSEKARTEEVTSATPLAI